MCVKAWPSSRAFAATSSPGSASLPTVAWGAAICVIRRGSNGRSSKPRSKATSSPTSRSAISRSTAPTRVTTSDMRRILLRNVTQGPFTEPAPAADEAGLAELAARLGQSTQARLGRTLSIREVDAGSCNGCELEIHALNNVLYDLERFGLRFVASPRHADVLFVTGPVTVNMREALERTYHATPSPKWVVAVGDCAINGGVFWSSYAVTGSLSQGVPLALQIRGG